MRKAKKTSFSIFWFVFISIVGVVFSQECNDTGGFFIHNSTYAANRELIFISLAFNVTQHGFYSSSIGKVPDQVYAMGMCSNGSEQAVCSECINIAVEQLKYNCRNHTEAFTWAPHKTLCFARYSNSSFYGRSDTHPHYTEYSSVGIKSYLGAFEGNWTILMYSMITKKNKGPFSNRNYFSTEKLKLENLPALYGLMQCTPDLTSDECGKCLEMSVGSYREGESRGKQGGTIAYPSCIFRWDLYPFNGTFNPKCEKISKGMIVAFVGPIGVIISVLSAAVAVLVCRRRKTDAPDESPSTNSLQYDLKTIEVATCTFSRSNILGQGGFGEVFKGVLQDGSEIAVKRLSTESAQGVQEFKNETSLVAKLQHRNLVRVLGFCMEGEEKILIYEFVPNKSLDHFLFEPTITKQGQLDWAKRYKIIFGTAKGILYLHNDAPLRIIHRDLKASNILLDADMKPKVADFGMARILEIDQSRADTRRVVGTIGYISPEYMMHGQFSTKSDVYSFGVLILEIISGKRNSNFHDIDDSGNNLVTHAWKHWKNGSPLELVDAEIGKNYQSNQVTRCIHVALLCVQNDPKDRPNISDVISMLNSNSTTLAVPQSPGYEGMEMALPPINSVNISINDSLINDLVPR